MVCKDTGLSNNSPSNTEVTPNNNLGPIADEDTDNDSDSDVVDEDRLGSYMPIPQVPSNEDEALFGPNSHSSDEDEIPTISPNINVEPIGAHALPLIEPAETSLVRELWSSQLPDASNIVLTDSTISEVKQAMLNFTLPMEAIPEWAKKIPEEQWKDELIKRLVNK